MADKETIWKSRDNRIDLILKEDGSATSLTGTTHVAVVFGSGSTISSVGRSTWFDWTSGTTGELRLKLGGTTVANGFYNAEIIVYNTDSSNGLVFGTVPILIKG